jgi:hypothetical protein
MKGALRALPWKYLAALWLAAAAPSPGAPFTYQGRLAASGQPANGVYDFRFTLNDALAEGNRIGPVFVAAPVLVSNGLFTVVLDFGEGAFDGTARWLDIGVRQYGNTDAYVLLAPRQQVTAAPFATFALSSAALSGGTTNATFYGGLSLGGATNVTLSVTNNFNISPVRDANRVFITGAGADAANGQYWLIQTKPSPVYGNNRGVTLTFLPENLDYSWQIADPTGGLLYGCVSDDPTDAAQWQTLNTAAAPRPATICYGTNYLTNTLAQLQISGLAAPAPSLGNNLYVNAAIGNDLFASRGRPDLPFRTLQAALAAATNDDVIRLEPGLYLETPFIATLPVGVRIIGAGKGATTVLAHPATTGQANLDLSSSNVLSSFTTDFLISLGGSYSGAYPTYGPATNVLLDSIEARGVGDVVYLQTWQSIRAVNCSFFSHSDCFVDFQSEPIGTNALAELLNCELKSIGPGGLLNNAIVNGGRGQMHVAGGSIEIQNSSEGACVFVPPFAPPGGSVELSGVAFRYSSTNSGWVSRAIANRAGANCRITLKGTFINPLDTAGLVYTDGKVPIWNLFGGMTTNITVIFPGNHTNQLQFINGALQNIVPQ